MAVLPFLGLVVMLSWLGQGEGVTLDWWQKGIFYQIYPRSFYDSDGDGIGDLVGIRLKADYLVQLGVRGVWISPFFTSPMKDFGYDISNFTEVDPMFGNLNDYTQMAEELKSRGISVVMDFVPNHSSDQHVWFEKSRRREDPYTDYYVWADGKGDNNTVPNNWISVFGGSAWEWCPTRNQYYLHQFLKEQPDFNYRNHHLREEMKNVLRFWLDHKIEGFRIDALRHMFEDAELRDEPLSHNPSASPDEYDYLIHNMTSSLPEVFDVLREWREVMDEYKAKDGIHRVVMLEVTAHSVEQLAPYYGNETHPLADLPFNFDLLSISNTSNAKYIRDIVQRWLTETPPTKWPNWVLGNHDNRRVANRSNVELVDAFNMISLLLKGTPITYYGEELGMVDTYVTWNETQDPFGKWFGEDRYQEFSRDPERTPMQWDGSRFAGFTEGTWTWLPVNPNYQQVNAENEKIVRRSHLNTYKLLSSLRRQNVFRKGDVYFPYVDDNVFSYVRAIPEESSAYVILVNVGFVSELVNLVDNNAVKEFRFPSTGIVSINSHNIPESSLLGQLNAVVDLDSIDLGPKEAVVIGFEPEWL